DQVASPPHDLCRLGILQGNGERTEDRFVEEQVLGFGVVQAEYARALERCAFIGGSAIPINNAGAMQSMKIFECTKRCSAVNDIRSSAAGGHGTAGVDCGIEGVVEA